MMSPTDEPTQIELKNGSSSKNDENEECTDEMWKSTKQLVEPAPDNGSLWNVFCHKLRRYKTALSTGGRDVRALVRFLRLQFHIRKAKSRNSTVPKLFMENAQKHPDKIAFYFEDEKWTFAQVDEYSNRVANYFKDNGIKKGDAVAMFMENSVEYICTWLGLTKIGAIPALVNYNQRMVALKHSISTANSCAIICSNDLQDALKEVLEEFQDLPLHVGRSKGRPITLTGAKDMDSGLKSSGTTCPPEIDSIGFGDNMIYIYTSGTTGLPKAAIIKHSRAFMAIFGGVCMAGLNTNDIIYSPMPLYHLASGLFGCGQALVYGMSVVLTKKFSASKYFKDCIRFECTAAQYIGEICRYLLNTPPKPEDTQHKVRMMFGNGLKPEIWEQFQERFKIKTISEFYGATEGNASLINVEGKPGAVGFLSVLVPSVYPCTLIRINDETGEPIRDQNGMCIRCKPGEPGELVGKIVRNDPVRDFHGYSDKKASSKKVSHDVFKKGDTAFMSGDILVMDEKGWLYFKDRTGDTFRWKGENVSTTEVESVISKATDNAATVVFGVEIPRTDGRAGMVAIHDPEDKVNLDHVFEEVKRNLPSYARPVFLRKVQQLEMTGTYKLKKTELKKDGFDLTQVKDQIFVLDPKEGYKPLTEEKYQMIMNGDVRL